MRFRERESPGSSQEWGKSGLRLKSHFFSELAIAAGLGSNGASHPGTLIYVHLIGSAGGCGARHWGTVVVLWGARWGKTSTGCDRSEINRWACPEIAYRFKINSYFVMA